MLFTYIRTRQRDSVQLKWLEVTNTPHYRAWRHCKPAHPSTVTCIELKTLRVTSLVVSTRCVVPGTTIQDAVYRMYIVVRCNSLLWKEEYVGIALQSRIMIHFIEAFLILWLYSCWRGLCSCLRRRSVHLLRTTPALGNVEDKCTESRGLLMKLGRHAIIYASMSQINWLLNIVNIMWNMIFLKL